MDPSNFASSLSISYIDRYSRYTLHIDLGPSKKTHYLIVVPVIFALLTNQTRRTYETTLRLGR